MESFSNISSKNVYLLSWLKTTYTPISVLGIFWWMFMCTTSVMSWSVTLIDFFNNSSLANNRSYCCDDSHATKLPSGVMRLCTYTTTNKNHSYQNAVLVWSSCVESCMLYVVGCLVLLGYTFPVYTALLMIHCVSGIKSTTEGGIWQCIPLPLIYCSSTCKSLLLMSESFGSHRK